MKHTKYLISALAIVSVTSSVYAATTSEPSNVATKPAVVVAATSADTTTSSGATTSPDALNVIGSPTVVSQTTNSVTLQWSKVPAAKTYIVKYAKNSVAQAFAKGDMTAIYDNETDPVTATGTTISNLKPDTTYYFTVVALDAAMNESTTNSEELSVDLSKSTSTGSVAPTATSSTSFKLTGVTVVNDKTVTVDFSAPLSQAPVSVKLTQSSDNSSVSVASVVADPAMPNRVIVNLGSGLSPSSSYSIIVIDATEANGLPIAEGVNAVKEFATLATLPKSTSEEAPTPTANTGATDTVDLNAAPEAGTGVIAVTTAEELPPTGTNENIILLVTALLALIIVYAFQKKRA